MEQSYLALARAYRRTLKQRNAWLKEGGGNVDPWMNSLAVLGAEINAFRGAYVEQLAFVLGDLIKVFSKLNVFCDPPLPVRVKAHLIRVYAQAPDDTDPR